MTKMPDHISDGPEYGDDEFTGFCHSHGMAFTDFCQDCEDDRQIEARLQRERDAGDETVEAFRETGQL